MYTDYCSRIYKSLLTINPYLREIGIKRDDLVYATPDGTINGSLYLMDQKGFTDFSVGSAPEEIRFNAIREYGVQYLVLLDTNFHRNPKLTPCLQHKIGTYKSVEIFDLESY